MPTIVVTDLNHVTIDGIASGSVTDILANRKDVGASDLLAALGAWRDACHCAHGDAMKLQCDAHAAALAGLRAKNDADLAARDAALADAVATERARGKTSLEALQAKHDAEVAKCNESAAVLEAKIKGLEADVADRQNTINALGGTELGQRLRDEARRKELLDAKVRLDAQLKELGIESSVAPEHD
jgi:hypothetical protein